MVYYAPLVYHIYYERLKYNYTHEYKKRIANKEFGLCTNCSRPNTYYMYWCQHCNSKRFQQNIGEWTSGNDHIDKFIQETQMSRNYDELLEWIPYDRFRNIQYLAQGGYSTIYKAIFLDGNIYYWKDNKKKWKRGRKKLKEEDYEVAKREDIKSPLKEDEKKGKYVALKCLNNSSNFHKDLLNEWKNYLQFAGSAKNNDTHFMKAYGMTRDPDTLNYMIVLQEVAEGSLRSNLMIKKYNPNDKYYNLYHVAKSLSALHKCNMVHGDLHSGNILFENYKDCYIVDFGLSRPANEPIDLNDICGVIPYIAPEILRRKPYTKAADIYSFGIIMWEFTSGVPAFNDMPHDFNLISKIFNKLRPKIVEGTHPDYAELMERCWDPDPNKRPTAEELEKSLDKWKEIYPIREYEDRRKVPENEPVVENHPLSCYVSRKLSEIICSKSLVVDLEEIDRAIQEFDNHPDLPSTDKSS